MVEAAENVVALKPERPELEGTYPHHPHCPACAADRQLAAAIRNVEGLRRARVRDDAIRFTLANGWYPEWLIDDALNYADEPATTTHTPPVTGRASQADTQTT